MIGSIRNGTPRPLEELDGLVQPLERPGPVGDRDDLDAPVGGPLAIAGVDAEHQLGPGRRRVGHLGRVEAIDRDPEAFLSQSADRIRHARPTANPGRSPGRSRRPPRRGTGVPGAINSSIGRRGA